MRYVHTWLLPDLMGPASTSTDVAVVIDVLRASTTIVAALENAARNVQPFAEIEAAVNAARQAGPQALLGGERGGERIDGFDLGNSPAEYSAETVGEKSVFLTTTNGTRALQYCRTAGRVLIGALTNAAAVARTLPEASSVHLVCAGTDGEVTREDVLGAGAILANLGEHLRDWQGNDASWLAWTAWRSLRTGDGPAPSEQAGETLREALRASRGGRNLIRLGKDADLEFAARVDSSATVPAWDLDTNLIRPTTV